MTRSPKAACGQLYLDGVELCLMVLDGEPAMRARRAALGGNLWMGDISKNTGASASRM